ncbi:f-box domain-containing protein [Ophiostoma piceae UAMH 11346]|uniref:F-box domain-containing protein n=1 Tax=Ophiostoma piceae (strain UAMH 11346) TaxID=1262450 RepID=S3BPB6_OPHP1|nr:f-box domain-containing protein [Ophiostoma piceae UAMH 11346]
MSAHGLLPPVSRPAFERLAVLDWEDDYWFERFDTTINQKLYSTHNYRPQPNPRPHTGFSKGRFGRAHVGTNPPQPGPESTLGDLGTLPWELVYCIIRELDLRSLEHLRTVSRQLNAIVLDLPEYRVLTRHAPQLLRSMLSSWAGAYFTLADIWRVLTTQDCEDHPMHSSGDGEEAPKVYRPFGAFVYLLTCKRVCMHCLKHDIRYSPLQRHVANDIYGMASLEPWLHDPQGPGGFSFCMDEVEVDPSPVVTLPFLQLFGVGYDHVPDLDTDFDRQVVDRPSACALAMELHGSAEAMWEWKQEAARWGAHVDELELLYDQKESWARFENKEGHLLMEPVVKREYNRNIENIEQGLANLYRRREQEQASAIVPPLEWLPWAQVKLPRTRRCRRRLDAVHTPSGTDALYKVSPAAAAQRVEKIMASPTPPAPPSTPMGVESPPLGAGGSDKPPQPEAVLLETLLAEKYSHLAHESGWEKVKQLYGNWHRRSRADTRTQFLSSVRVPWINLHANPSDETRPDREPHPHPKAWGVHPDYNYWTVEALEETQAEEEEEKEKETARQREMDPDLERDGVLWEDLQDETEGDMLSIAAGSSTWNQDGIQVEYGAHCSACGLDDGVDMDYIHYEDRPMYSTATYAYHLAEHGPVVGGVHQRDQSTTG